MIKILLIGDRSDSVIAHGAIPKALELAARSLSPAHRSVDFDWLPTNSIHSASDVASKKTSAIWSVPGSPYASTEGALTAIRFAREQKIPFLGTCGGFQHAILEYARNVLNIPDADHQESNPTASAAVISKLSCALINKSETLTLAADSKLRAIYNSTQIAEPYQCSYGINPAFQKLLSAGDLAFTAFNDVGEPRAFELRDHPFFIGTLFQPERSALGGKSHPLIAAFLNSASPAVTADPVR